MCFHKKETNNVEQMELWLQNFMLDYLREHADDGDDLVPIFSDTRDFIRTAGEKNITKLLKKNRITAEEGILNILQNHAMFAITPKSGAAFIMGYDDAADKLYKDLNDLKLSRGYISKRQHAENEKAAAAYALTPPGGRWL